MHITLSIINAALMVGLIALFTYLNGFEAWWLPACAAFTLYAALVGWLDK